MGTLVETGRCKEEERELILFGLQSVAQLSTAVFTIIFMGALLGLLLECLVFLATFWAIRSFAGGFHCKSAKICYLTSCSTMTLLLLVVKFTNENDMILLIFLLLAVSIPLILKYCPLDTPTKPLDEVERKHFRKKAILHLVVETVVICLFVAIGQKVLAFTMCLAVFLSSMVLVAELVRRKFTRGDSHSGEF